MQALEFIATDGSLRWALKFGVKKINLHKVNALFAPHTAFASLGTADLLFLSPTFLR